MNILTYLAARLNLLPALLKGAKIGKHSFLGPGYDFLSVRLKGLVLGDNVLIGRNAWIELVGPEDVKIHIGSGTNIGRHVTMSARKGISIGSKCLVSYNVSFLDHDHAVGPTLSPMDSGLTEGEEIRVADHCFIGAHSFILKGVSLGRHVVVGANSVVTKSFPDGSVVAGNPARLINNLGQSSNDWPCSTC